MATSAVVPWERKDPMVMSWSSNVIRYRAKKIRNSKRPTTKTLANVQEDVHQCENANAIVHIPTAAFLLVVEAMRNATTMALKADTTMFATFPTEPLAPTLGIPQSGLTPTGAVWGSEEFPSKTLDACFSN
jgi:hypothetical protein